MANRIYVPIESFRATNQDMFVKDQTRVREGHPILTQFPHMFREADCQYEWPEAEQATASPGERRGEKRAREAV